MWIERTVLLSALKRRRRWFLLPALLLLLNSVLFWRALELQASVHSERQHHLQARVRREEQARNQAQLHALQAHMQGLPRFDAGAASRVLGYLHDASARLGSSLRYREVAASPAPAPLQALALELTGKVAAMPVLLAFLDDLQASQSGTEVESCDVSRAADQLQLLARCKVRWVFREED
ncbi:hypothetical protein Q4485_11510 [Granulosicoccaceae sp. 1_MG-2023]|nr:hypothetical protein [Granulosicoccaceae sp. 1_MG-2023]